MRLKWAVIGPLFSTAVDSDQILKKKHFFMFRFWQDLKFYFGQNLGSNINKKFTIKLYFIAIFFDLLPPHAYIFFHKENCKVLII
jgi:hypothetical protein